MAYDRLKNNVNVINWALTRNGLSLSTEVNGVAVSKLATDLSNFADLGAKVSELDADKLKSFAKDLVVGLARNVFITDAYTAETHGIVKNMDAYYGALQRIAIKNLPEVQESHAQRLISGVNYIDGKFYGNVLSAEIYNDQFNFKIPYSIGYEDIRARFNDIQWVDKTIGEFEIAVRNSLEIKMAGIADSLLNKAIVDAVSSGRKVPLVTKYCQYFGYVTDNANNYTWAQIKASETLFKQFAGFVSMTIGLVSKAMTRMGYKFNNGEVPNFCPASRLRLLGLVEFIKIVDNLGYANIFNEGIIDKAQVEQVVAWQSEGQDMLPLLTETGSIKDGTFTLNSAGTAVTAEDATTYNNIVMFLYDTDMMGASYVLDKVGVEEVSAELFRTYHHHFGCKTYLDERGCAVAFTLE